MKLSTSTSSVDLLNPESAFDLASTVKLDGVEVMVTPARNSQSANYLNDMIQKYQVPATSIHAPTLLLCKFVWSTNARVKLLKSAELAAQIGATKVVVHPPFKTSSYSKEFIETANRIQNDLGVTIAIENMFPWKVRGKEIEIYGPSWDETVEKAHSLTMDFSHAAASSLDILSYVKQYHKKLQVMHLCDGSDRQNVKGDPIMDEHLLPGQGTMPIKEVYEFLQQVGWDGDTTIEINARKMKSFDEKIATHFEIKDFFKSIIAPQPAPALLTSR